jgi:hypothetical protein
MTVKSLTIAAAAIALLASGLIFADQPEQALPHVAEQQRQIDSAALADPQSFSDDICWTAPDLQDS